MPGKRVEFPEIPLSAFTRKATTPPPVKATTTPVTATTPESKDNWLAQGFEKWLSTPTTSQIQEAMDTGDEEYEVPDVNPWLLVERTVKSEPVRSGSCGSIEEWLMAAASDREPSIVIISEDETDDVISGFSGDFASFR